MSIRKLSPLLVNQIAAGEVIERPASVVKELIENSLDAGASRIGVAVEEGGATLIRVSDDGFGIAPGELPLAVAPHATSKIATSDDLAAIATLGFRGEALASVASVSRLRVTSRATIDGQSAEAGESIEVEGDRVSPVAPAAASPGTVIEVRDLFFNTPARRKFLRAASTEFGHINETVTRLAMAHPHVGFTLTHNGRKVTDVAATESRRQRCVELLGREIDEAMLEFEDGRAMGQGRSAEGSDSMFGAASDSAPLAPGPRPSALSLWGLAGLPAVARASAKFQYVYLNGRMIRDKRISHAIREAYRGLVPPDRNAVAVLFLDMDPAQVDVNVHPAKAEVRFRDANRVHGLVLNAMRQRLLGADLTPKARLAFGDLDLPGVEEDDAAGRTDSLADLRSQIDDADAAAASVSASAFVDYFKRMEPQQRGFVYEQVRQAMVDDDPEGLLASHGEPGSPGGAFNGSASSHGAPLRPTHVLQVHKSYVVTQDDDGLVIIDQHALHERVMFEELKRRVLGRSLESQRLLMPAVIDASPGRLEALEQAAPLLERIGVEAEPIGPRSIGVQAFPTFLFDRKVEPHEFLTDLLDRIEDGTVEVGSSGGADGAMEAALHEVLDMMACKAAVKAGDQMSEQELSALLARRGEVERSSNCPHGRPTTLRLSLKDLERQFGRT